MNLPKVLSIILLSTGCFLVPNDDKEDAKSIAVLPFESLDAQKPNAGRGASDAILTKFVAAGALMVSKAKLEELTEGQTIRSVKALKLGEKLGATWVVLGTVDFVAGEVAVSAQVLDVASKNEIISERIHGSIDDTFALYDDIAVAVTKKMATHIPTLRFADSPAVDTDFQFDDGDAPSAVVDNKTLGSSSRRQSPKPPRSKSASAQETTELIELGIVQHKRGDLKGAIKLLRRAVDRSPRSARAKVALGHALIARKDFGGAQTVLQKAVKNDRTDAAAWTYLGYAKDKSGELASGQKDYRRALRINEGYGLAHYYLAANLYNSDEPLEARTHCKRAMELGNRKARGLLPRIDRKIRKMKD